MNSPEALAAIAQQLEILTKHCPKCGVELMPTPTKWDIKGNHKYCGYCRMVTYNFFAGNMGLADEFIV